MTHAVRRRCAWLGIAMLLGVLAGCGGESSVSVGVPTDNNGPLIVGQVLMPNGQLAAVPSTWERLASAVVARVEALVNGTVRPVGGGVGVRLTRIGNANIVNGQIRNAITVAAANTGPDGGFGIHLPTGTSPNTCRFLMEVGSGRTLTRAFVDREQVTVDFESEAVVRLVLQQIGNGAAQLCDLDAGDLGSIRGAVESSDHEAFGDTASAANSAAVIAASSDPAVQAAISQAFGQATPPPVATNTASVPPTLTATVPLPTATQPGATATAQATRTNTAAPTRTSTGGPTSLPTRTNTLAPSNTPSATSTATGVPTGTAAATATFTVSPTRTPTAISTATIVATGTATAPVTVTFTFTRTPTVVVTPTATPAMPEINLGVIAGTAGLAVDLPVVLVARGAAFAAVSSDIEFDSAALSVSTTNGVPACAIDARLAGLKEVLASASDIGGGRTRLRVGVIARDNNAVISSGVLYSCRFLIAPSASGSVALRNAAAAAGQQAQPIAVVGGDGRIEVAEAPTSLGLVAGTVAAVGGTAEVMGVLDARDQLLAAVSTDIRFPADRLRAVVGGSGDPDCGLDDEIAALGKTLLVAALPADGGGRPGVRVGVIGANSNTALPAGEPATLFRCRFIVQSGGGPINLEQSAEAASLSAQPAGLFGPSGSISVQ